NVGALPEHRLESVTADQGCVEDRDLAEPARIAISGNELRCSVSELGRVNGHDRVSGREASLRNRHEHCGLPRLGLPVLHLRRPMSKTDARERQEREDTRENQAEGHDQAKPPKNAEVQLKIHSFWYSFQRCDATIRILADEASVSRSHQIDETRPIVRRESVP